MRTHPLQTIFACFLLYHFLPCSALAQRSKSAVPQPSFYQQQMQSAALVFMENKGQVADDEGNLRPDILFTSGSGGAKLFLTATGIHYQFSKTEYPKGYDPFSKEIDKDPQQEAALRKQIKTTTHHFSVELPGANPHPTINKKSESSYFENYYLPQCPNGVTDVRGYEKIVYQNVYPNIDWVVYSKGGFMEYDFLVHPGGNPAIIKLKIKDANNATITPRGELLIKTRLGEVKEKAPVSFVDGRIVASRFKQNSDGTIGFTVQPQPGKELRIDPSIVWSTYYGSAAQDAGNACTTDASGNAYLAGLTMSLSNITAGGFQNTHGGDQSDAFLVKFGPSGNRLWATYYGGNKNDGSSALATDMAGNLFLAGRTNSSSGIASNGFQATSGGQDDAFLVKFGSSGNRLWSTYYGGNAAEYPSGCSTDVNGNVYLSGSTNSPDNIASGGFQNTATGNGDAFLVKFGATGNRLWGTYYGGTSSDAGNGCSVDNSGFIYLSGSTSSDGLAYQGYRNTKLGSADNYLVKFTGTGSRVWATYYGGESYESVGVCATDPSGNVYLAGVTPSSTNIAFNGYRNNNSGGTDFYLAKFTGSGDRLWATYYGGSADEMNPSISCNAAGNTYLGGSTASSNGIYFNGLPNNQSYGGYFEAFIVKFGADGNCAWGTYFGGSDLDLASACTTDNAGNVYLTGQTGSPGLGVNGFQNTLVGAPYDAFFVKIGDEPLCISATQPTISATSDTICTGTSTTLSVASGNLNSATTWQWRKDSCNGANVGTGTSMMVSPTVTTTYYVKGEGGCAATGSCTSKTIVVKPVVTPTVSLAATPSSIITAGTSVTFTATATHGGNVPFYAFKVNGLVIQNGPNSTFTTNTLVNGDVVTATLTSNATCVSSATANSNAINIIVAAPCIAPTTPTISTNYDTVCTGATPTLTVSSGSLNSATRWQWYMDSCGGISVGNTNSITVTPSATTTYYLRGEGGCTTLGACVSKTIYVKPKPVVSFSTLPGVLCAGDTGTVTFTGAAPATAAYTWNWGGGTVISGTGAGPYKVVFRSTGSIGLTVDNGTCSVASVQQTISILPTPIAAFNMSDTTGCGQVALTLTNTSRNATAWYWSLGNNRFSTDSIPPPSTYTKGVYTISLRASIGSCSTTIARTLRVVEKPTARFTAIPSSGLAVPLSQAFFSFTNSSTQATTYRWQFGDGGTSSQLHATYRYSRSGNYAVKLLAYNSPHCIDSFELKPLIVTADTASSFYIPNAFSPNDDGVNDRWIVAALQPFSNCRVNIYNRWGQTIFTSTGYNKPWDGKRNGKPLPVGTYYYLITIEKKSYSGFVVLLR